MFGILTVGYAVKTVKEWLNDVNDFLHTAKMQAWLDGEGEEPRPRKRASSITPP
jgi:hypothetical protein